MAITYDVVVVGAGMFGSAAFKYLSKAGERVLAIGLDEPTRGTAASQRAFGAYYDEARITRRLGWDAVWGATDSRSLNRFRDIEAESGIAFFEECGSLVVMPRSIATRTDSIVGQCDRDLISVERISAEVLRRYWGCLTAPPLEGGVEGLFERRMAGYLRPRRLVAAQLLLAERAGGFLLKGSVLKLKKDGWSGLWRLLVQQGEVTIEVSAKKVLVAAGAFTNHNGVLPDDCRLALRTFAEPNLLVELDRRDADRLRCLPPIVTVDAEDNGERNMSVYLLPPIEYPDGNWYIRIGPGMQPIVQELKTLEEMLDWYIRQRITCGQRDFLAQMLEMLVPDVKPVSFREACCIIEKTPSRYPYIGRVNDDESLNVVVAGNGHGARGSDEIGRLAANVVMGAAWDFPIERDVFAPLLALGPSEEEERPDFLRPPFGLC